MPSTQKHGGVRMGHSITLHGPGHLTSGDQFRLGATSALYIAYCECGCSAIDLTPEDAYQRLSSSSSTPTNPAGSAVEELQLSSHERDHVHKLMEKLNNGR